VDLRLRVGRWPRTTEWLGGLPLYALGSRRFGWRNGYGSIPINTIFNGMNIHLPAILMFTRGTRFWHTAKCSRFFFSSYKTLSFRTFPLFGQFLLACLLWRFEQNGGTLLIIIWRIQMGYFPLYQLLGVSKTTRVWLCWEFSNVSFDSAGNWGLGKHWEHTLLRNIYTYIYIMLPKKNA